MRQGVRKGNTKITKLKRKKNSSNVLNKRINIPPLPHVQYAAQISGGFWGCCCWVKGDGQLFYVWSPGKHVSKPWLPSFHTRLMMPALEQDAFPRTNSHWCELVHKHLLLDPVGFCSSCDITKIYVLILFYCSWWWYWKTQDRFVWSRLQFWCGRQTCLEQYFYQMVLMPYGMLFKKLALVSCSFGECL